MDSNATPSIPGHGLALRRWAGPLLILLLMVAGYVLGLHRYVSLAAIAENRDALRDFTDRHALLMLSAFMALYVAAVALSIPGATVLTLVGGFLFGWFLGGLATVVSATLGSILIFSIVRSSFGAGLARRAGPFLSRLADGFENDAFNYLLFLRLVPAFPFWLVNIAPALANVKLRTFAAATFLGIMPATFAIAFVGQGLDGLIDAQMKDHIACVAEKGLEACPFELSPSSLVTREMLLAFAALGLVALVPIAYRKFRGTR